jgi:ubiquinone/menaquinone biosynthesis C-methylase UbiE
MCRIQFANRKKRSHATLPGILLSFFSLTLLSLGGPATLVAQSPKTETATKIGQVSCAADTSDDLSDDTSDKAGQGVAPREASESEIPPAKSTYMGRRIAPTMSFAHAAWLIRPERQQEEDPQQMLDQLGLKPGMVVCDMGCGNGFYSLEMARRVAPTGKVYAVDIQQEMLHLLHLRAEETEIDNVETKLGTVVDPFLPEGELDLVLMVDVYHEFSHPEQMLQAIRRSLKPDGLIALVEFRAEDPKVPILPLHKMSKRQIMREYRANGFRLVKQYDELPWQHLMFFQRIADER